ncbi:hypothetical protein MHBO_000949 [Bonamia ostreae]|uniref:Uncharacterized protein n=1 Tax=Bonamia ostreae TaxID=126728 RepID=A0ABV2AHD3_9EUKA
MLFMFFYLMVDFAFSAQQNLIDLPFNASYILQDKSNSSIPKYRVGTAFSILLGISNREIEDLRISSITANLTSIMNPKYQPIEIFKSETESEIKINEDKTISIEMKVPQYVEPLNYRIVVTVGYHSGVFTKFNNGSLEKSKIKVL